MWQAGGYSSRGPEIIHLQGQMNGTMLAFHGALNISRHVYGLFLSLILGKINLGGKKKKKRFVVFSERRLFCSNWLLFSPLPGLRVSIVSARVRQVLGWFPRPAPSARGWGWV